MSRRIGVFSATDPWTEALFLLTGALGVATGAGTVVWAAGWNPAPASASMVTGVPAGSAARPCRA